MSSTDAMAKDPGRINPEKPKRPKTDWESYRARHRAGQLTAREIALAAWRVPHSHQQTGKAESWVQDPSRRSGRQREAGLVSSEVSSGNTREAVQAATAQRVVEAVRSHLQGHQVRPVTSPSGSSPELDGTTSKVGEIEEIIAKETEAGPAAAP